MPFSSCFEKPIPTNKRGASHGLAVARGPGAAFLLGRDFTLVDIAVLCAVGQVGFASVRPGWQDKYPVLAAYWTTMEERQIPKEMARIMFDLHPKGRV